jgi:hypothetical protein
MRSRVLKFSAGALAMILAGWALPAGAQITGNLDTTSVGYGEGATAPYTGQLATQTVNTGFGDAAGGADSANGSELDAAYGTIQGSYLAIFLAGNVQNNGNHLNIFVDGGAPGQSTLALPATGTMQAMNGSIFSPGFQATYAYDSNDFSGTFYNEEYVYGGPGVLSGGYVGSVAETSTGIGAGTPNGGSFPAYANLAVNNNNASTMGAPGTATNPTAVNSTATGFEIQIPLAQIGYTGGNIMVLADINGGGDTYLSNQFLPGLPVGTQNLGSTFPGGTFNGPGQGTFNFGSTPGEYFTVAVPEPASIGLLIGAGAAMLLSGRRRTTR